MRFILVLLVASFISSKLFSQEAIGTPLIVNSSTGEFLRNDTVKAIAVVFKKTPERRISFTTETIACWLVKSVYQDYTFRGFHTSEINKCLLSLENKEIKNFILFRAFDW